VIEYSFPTAGSKGDFRSERRDGPLRGGKQPVRILIADHQQAVRSAVRFLLEERLELRVVGEAADGQELLAQLGSLRPDIIVIDWDLPRGSTDELFDAFRELDRRPKVIVLGAHPESAQAAMAAGASSFVSKGDPPKRLLTVLHALSVEGQCE
jgi:DNA-binding NarL/FixJ family response regulator